MASSSSSWPKFAALAMSLFLMLLVLDNWDVDTPAPEDIIADFKRVTSTNKKFLNQFMWLSANGTNTSNTTGSLVPTCTISGPGCAVTITASVTYSGQTIGAPTNWSIAAGQTITFNNMVFTAVQIFESDGAVAFTGTVTVSATMTFRNKGGFTSTNAVWTLQAGANLVFAKVAGATGIVTFTGSTINMVAGVVVTMQTTIAFIGSTMAGAGTCDVNGAGAMVSSGSTTPSGNKWSITMLIVTVAARRRLAATSFASGVNVQWCGDDATGSTVTVGSGDGLTIDTQSACGAAKGGSVTVQSGGYLVFKSVSASSVGSTATALSLSTSATVEVLTSSAAEFDVTLLTYPATTCFSTWKENIATCGSGYDCKTYSSGPANGMCMIKFKSMMASQSNNGLYALFALLVIPIFAIIAFIIYKRSRPVSYPVVAQEPASMYYPSAYPEYPVMNTPVY